MRLFIRPDGEIAISIYKNDLYKFDTSVLTNPNLYYDIDSNVNKSLCIDIIRYDGLTNRQGLGKYYISNNQLNIRDGWVEWRPV